MGLLGEILTCDFCGGRCAEYAYPDFEMPFGWHETGNTEENGRFWCPVCWDKAEQEIIAKTVRRGVEGTIENSARLR